VRGLIRRFANVEPREVMPCGCKANPCGPPRASGNHVDFFFASSGLLFHPTTAQLTVTQGASAIVRPAQFLCS
jgi:hypothetical protein